jgi:hypothetical protein
LNPVHVAAAGSPETLERHARGTLYCVACDGAIVLDLPPLVGFIRADDPNSDLCGFAVCEAVLPRRGDAGGAHGVDRWGCRRDFSVGAALQLV